MDVEDVLFHGLAGGEEGSWDGEGEYCWKYGQEWEETHNEWALEVVSGGVVGLGVLGG